MTTPHTTHTPTVILPETDREKAIWQAGYDTGYGIGHYRGTNEGFAEGYDLAVALNA